MVMLPPRVLVRSQQPKSMRWSLERPPRRTLAVLAVSVPWPTECWYTCSVKMKWESRP